MIHWKSCYFASAFERKAFDGTKFSKFSVHETSKFFRILNEPNLDLIQWAQWVI